jgi:hypothetical protein
MAVVVAVIHSVARKSHRVRLKSENDDAAILVIAEF